MRDADAIRRLSDELARDPASRAFLPLADLLLAEGELDAAARIARRGAARHARDAAAHDLVARVAAARGQWPDALTAWEEAIALAPAGSSVRAEARRGQAYACFRLGRLDDAERCLDAAEAEGADPAAVAAARQRLRPDAGGTGGAADVRDGTRLFDALLEPGDRTALLVLADGRVAAGRCLDAGGTDVSDAVGRALNGIADEAGRAMRHLALGGWQAIVVEAEGALVALAPAGDAVALVAATPATPLGRLRRSLERVAGRARSWRGLA